MNEVFLLLFLQKKKILAHFSDPPSISPAPVRSTIAHGVFHQGQQAQHHLRARLAARNRSQLGDADGDDARHGYFPVMSFRSIAAAMAA